MKSVSEAREFPIVLAPISHVDENPYQARRHTDGIEQLADSIHAWRRKLPDTLGLQQVPIGRLTANGRIQLMFGHRRLKAFFLLAEKDKDYLLFPVRIGEFTDLQMLDGAWEENNKRLDISDIERAELMNARYRMTGKQEEIAEAWGISRTRVSSLISLNDLPDFVKEANRSGRISGRTTYELLRLYKINPRSQYLRKAVNNPDKYNSTALRRIVIRARQKNNTSVRPITSRNGSSRIHDTPSLRLSGTKVPNDIEKTAVATCNWCCIDGPPTDTICKVCPLVFFLRTYERNNEHGE